MKRSLIRITFLVVLLAALLIACGPDQEAPEAEIAPPGTSYPTPQATAGVEDSSSASAAGLDSGNRVGTPVAAFDISSCFAVDEQGRVFDPASTEAQNTCSYMVPEWSDYSTLFVPTVEGEEASVTCTAASAAPVFGYRVRADGFIVCVYGTEMAATEDASDAASQAVLSEEPTAIPEGASEVGNLLLQGALPEFNPPNTTRFEVREVILPDPDWSVPGFAIPWPKHSIQDGTRQDAPPANGVELWYAFQVRPGDRVLGNGTGVATDAGWYDEGNSFWFENNTNHQVTLYVRNGEVMVMADPNDDATMDEMAQVLLKFVISTNGLESAAFLGKIP